MRRHFWKPLTNQAAGIQKKPVAEKPAGPVAEPVAVQVSNNTEKAQSKGAK